MTTVASSSEQQTPQKVAQLSDYEQLRLDNIHRNETKLKQLGLLKPIVRSVLPKRPVTKQPKSTKLVVPSGPTRTSTRKKRKVASYYEDDTDRRSGSVRNRGGRVRRESDDESSDYDEPNSIIEDDDDVFDDSIPVSDEDDDAIQNNAKRSRRRRTNTTTTTTPKSSTKPKLPPSNNTDPTALGGILCETAKSSRSTCRKCRIKIEKDTPRVGMQAWIVGRQALTWQCPPCFLANLTCTLEKTGRSKCQLTRENFGKGEIKVGVRSHTATFWYGLEVVGKVLGAVLGQVGGDERDKVGMELVRLDRIEGSDALGEEDRVKLQTVLMNVVADVKTGSIASKSESMVNHPVTPVTPDTKASDLSTVRKAQEARSQPEIGRKSGMKGKVEWKFGGHLCYGTLLPSNETFTHCYARTHKGNVKTLAKGKGYWSIIG